MSFWTRARWTLPGFAVVIALTLTSLPAGAASMGEGPGSATLHPRTPITCGTPRELRGLSRHGNDWMRYRCEPRTLREAVEYMDNSDIYFVDTQRDGFYVRFPGEILFDNGVATLPAGSRSLLERLADVLKDFPDHAVEVRGHASSPAIATTEFPSNQKLSEARARAVARYLIRRQNLSRERVTSRGFGARLPLAEEIDAASERLNRRVDFFLQNGE